MRSCILGKHEVFLHFSVPIDERIARIGNLAKSHWPFGISKIIFTPEYNPKAYLSIVGS